MTVILDARPTEAWTAGHFAGALNAELDRFLSTAADPGFDPAPGGRHPLPPVERWARQLGLWGIGPQTDVLVYDGAFGESGACRLWWMLRASGHRHVTLLEGGIPAGRAQGWTWTQEPPNPPPALGPYPVRDWGLPWLDAEGAAAFASDSQRLLVDVRAPARWRGETEPLDPVAGHIPGSVNVFLGANLDSEGRFRSAQELWDLYGPPLAGRTPERVAVHCGSGVSACATLYAFEIMGFSGASLYVGSYSQWCRTGRAVAREAQ